MAGNFRRLIFSLFFVAAAALFVNAQSEADNSKPNPKEDLPKGIQESLAKQRIDRAKKDFAELLEHGEEALKISNELEKSFAQTNTLSGEDAKKLDRLEKVVKKIRTELGAEKDDDDNEKDTPLSVSKALTSLKDDTIKLVDELKKTTRYSVSVVAVESSNALLSIVRFLRFRKN